MEIPKHIIRYKDTPTSNSVEEKYEKSKQQIIKDLYPLKQFTKLQRMNYINA